MQHKTQRRINLEIAEGINDADINQIKLSAKQELFRSLLIMSCAMWMMDLLNQQIIHECLGIVVTEYLRPSPSNIIVAMLQDMPRKRTPNALPLLES